MKARINAWCTKIGADPLLTQGAGGNVSWKEKQTLWIKASGTHLADAQKKDIFVSVDLAHLRKAILEKDFSVTPQVLTKTTLRPSIETLLHALMPYPIVVHLHAVEILAHLVRKNSEVELERLLDKEFRWISVNYHKPGAMLASAVHFLLAKTEAPIIFLKNHGLVLGGESLDQIDRLLATLITQLKIAPQTSYDLQKSPINNLHISKEYQYCAKPHIHQLALDDKLYARVRNDWALYPDHVVFLGPKAVVIEDFDQLRLKELHGKKVPPFLFLRGKSVLEHVSVNCAQKAQLQCYYDVLVRQNSAEDLSTLSDRQIAELLNWDAEQFRKGAQR